MLLQSSPTIRVQQRSGPCGTVQTHRQTMDLCQTALDHKLGSWVGPLDGTIVDDRSRGDLFCLPASEPLQLGRGRRAGCTNRRPDTLPTAALLFSQSGNEDEGRSPADSRREPCSASSDFALSRQPCNNPIPQAKPGAPRVSSLCRAPVLEWSWPLSGAVIGVWVP